MGFLEAMCIWANTKWQFVFWAIWPNPSLAEVSAAQAKASSLSCSICREATMLREVLLRMAAATSEGKQSLLADLRSRVPFDIDPKDHFLRCFLFEVETVGRSGAVPTGFNDPHTIKEAVSALVSLELLHKDLKKERDILRSLSLLLGGYTWFPFFHRLGLSRDKATGKAFDSGLDGLARWTGDDTPSQVRHHLEQRSRRARRAAKSLELSDEMHVLGGRRSQMLEGPTKKRYGWEKMMMDAWE